MAANANQPVSGLALGQAAATVPATADSLDLTVFLGGLRREIQDLHAGMKASRDGRFEKAFQRVPRNLRRRTASHNAKRLPRRLRQQARRDQTADNTPSVATGLAKRKKGRTARAWVYENTKKRIGQQQERKLARSSERTEGDGEMEVDAENDADVKMNDAGDNGTNNTDNADDGLNTTVTTAAGKAALPIENLRLPTHRWHAKRAHMANPGAQWHNIVAQSATNKTYRATLRSAGLRPGTCVCWDTSFKAAIFVEGSATQLDEVLTTVVEPQLLTSALRRGACCVDVQLPLAFGYQRRQHGQVPEVDGCELGGLSGLCGPGNCGAMTLMYNPVARKATSTTMRQALLHVHPMLFAHVWTTLQHDVATKHPDVRVRDGRLEVGSIDVTGTAAASALAATLYPYDMGPHGRDFLQLRRLDTTALAPASGVLLSFSIQDPRLDEPEGAVVEGVGNSKRQSETAAGGALAAWPSRAQSSDTLQPSGLFDSAVRHKAARQLAQSTLDRRRGNLKAGAKLLLQPTESPPIPILLVVAGASVPVAADPNRRGGSDGKTNSRTPPTWTLLAPRTCIDLIWRRLMLHRLGGGQRPQMAGLDEARHMALERGRPWFPADFPGTAAGWDWEMQGRVRRTAAWEAKPPSKRTSWATLGVGGRGGGELGSGFACDWEHLFGVESVSTAMATTGLQDAVDGNLPKDVALPPVVREMHHVTWSEVRAAVATKQQQQQQQQQTPTWRTPYPLLTVSVQLLWGGVPHPLARVYRLPTEDVALSARWLALAGTAGRDMRPHVPRQQRMPLGADMATRKALLAQSLLAGPALPYPRQDATPSGSASLPLPGADLLLGFVTSGAHRFQSGRGFGIGHLRADTLVDAVVEAGGEGGKMHKHARFCIVRNVGERVGHLARWTPISH